MFLKVPIHVGRAMANANANVLTAYLPCPVIARCRSPRWPNEGELQRVYCVLCRAHLAQLVFARRRS